MVLANYAFIKLFLLFFHSFFLSLVQGGGELWRGREADD